MINYDFTSISEPVAINKNYGMQYKAKVLNLVGFEGDVIVATSNFTNNRVKYKDCTVFSQADSDILTSPITSSDDFEIYLPLNAYQENSLFTIRNHMNSVTFAGNIFAYNAGVGALINIEIKPILGDITKPVILFSNIFNQNSGYSGTNLISVTSRVSSTYWGTNIPTDSKIPCSGILLSDNVFKNNFGCAQYSQELLSV